MKQSVLFASLAVCLLSAPGSVALAQPPAGPGPEHEKLKEFVGTWDCEVIVPGVPVSKAVAVHKMTLGGMWMESTFEGNFAGQEYSGRGLDSYDAVSQQYKSVWVDSMTGFPSVFSGTYDDSGKVLTMHGESTGPDGQPVKMKSVSTWVDKDHTKFRMFTVDGDNEVELMTINYSRRK